MPDGESTPENLELSLAPDLANKFKLQSGKKLIFESSSPVEVRVVLAEWFEELVENSGKTLQIPVRISNAVIRGKLVLRHCVFESDFVITDSHFLDEVDLSYSLFQRQLSFERYRFARAVKFAGLETRRDFEISEAEFSDNAECRAMNIGKAIQARGTRFSRVDCDGTVVQGDALFISSPTGRPATFGSCTTFISSKVLGQADFSSAQFLSDAHFDLMRVDGGAFFRRDEFRESAGPASARQLSYDYPPVRFLGDATFVDAHFSAQADFAGVQFASSASFDGMVVEGDAQFGKDDSAGPATFGAEARFPAVVIRGQANFIGAVFKGHALFRQARVAEESLFGDAVFHQACVFDHFRFEGPAFFRDRTNGLPTRFMGSAEFRGAIFLSVAHFDGICFYGSVSFDGARFESHADFRNSSFAGEAVFAGVSTTRDLCFQKAVFKGMASFRETSCRALFLRDHMARDIGEGADCQFYGGLNLIGLCYERIYVAWGELLDKLEPFDEHPYAQLERALRGMGDDASAGEVYFRQRKRALKLYWGDWRQKWWRAICDSAYYALARFGVRPIRLFAIAVILLCFTATVFSLPDAVIPKRDFGNSPRQLVWLESLGVAVNLFLPVEVPIGAAWRPSEEPVPIAWMRIGSIPITFAFWATVLRLAGWIIVPLGLATITGILRRRGMPGVPLKVTTPA